MVRNCPRENPVNFDGGERNFRVRSVAAAAAAAGAGERASFIALLAIVCVLATLSPLFPEISISSGAVAREGRGLTRFIRPLGQRLRTRVEEGGKLICLLPFPAFLHPHASTIRFTTIIEIEIGYKNNLSTLSTSGKSATYHFSPTSSYYSGKFSPPFCALRDYPIAAPLPPSATQEVLPPPSFVL